MLHIPAVGPSVILVIGVACAYATREAIVERLKKLSVLVLRMEERGLRVEQRAIVVRQLGIALRVLLVATEGGNAREAPQVVGGTEAHGHRLTLLEARHVGIGLLLTVTQGWYEAVLPVELIDPSRLVAAPRCECLLLNALTAIVEAALGIHLQSFPQRVGHHCHTVV